jgi:7-carboxy-7-deazaguanine synthase
MMPLRSGMPMKIAELFSSIQGESTFAGLPCTFVRTAGCNLRCSYCDTLYARAGGTEMTVGHICRVVKEAGIALVELTGGEPLLQEESYRLMDCLLGEGYRVLLETNGSVSVERLDKRVIKIMDLKCPGSGMSGHMMFSNLDLLNPDDEIKCVISDKADFDWAVRIIRDYRLVERCSVLISPVLQRLMPAQAAEWILQERLPVRLQLQQHKLIWPEKASGPAGGY